MKRALWILAAVVLVGALSLSVGLTRVRNGPGLPSGTTRAAGLSAPVEVLWDSLGVPHIFAGSVEDAYFAQGMAHAHDRLWQMEFFRRVANGTLSEILGEATLESDRFLRTLGMGRVAARSVETLDTRTRRRLQAYMDGVNLAIEEWKGPLPPEFLVLRFRPEPFTIEDALAIERIMAWDLTSYGNDLNEAARMASLSPEAFARIRSLDPPGGTTILGGRRGLGDAPEAADSAGALDSERSRAASAPPTPDPGPPSPESAADIAPALVRAGLLDRARPPEGLALLLDAVSASRASNAWVVGGERSASGRPLVANDMHLALNRPTLFYLVGVHAPGLDVVGMSIPGAPGIVAGRSAGVAWGFTNANVDDTDFYLERVDPTDTTRYVTPSGSEPFDLRTELIAVSGRDAPDTLVVRETRHGPIMTPVESRLGQELVALKWVAHDDSSSIPAVLEMNQAQSVQEFLEALPGFRTLHQNVVFADTAGRWGYWMAGRVPLRGTPRPPIGVLEGWTGEGEWQGYLPFDLHPHALEPEVGYVATANNRQSPDSIADLVSPGFWATPYRAERISQLIEARPLHDTRSMLDIQLDVVTLQGRRFRAEAAAGYRAAGAAEVAALLEEWQGDASLERVEPTWFQRWYDGVRRALGRQVWGPNGAPRQGGVDPSAVDRWIAAGIPDSISERAAREALEPGAARPWGEIHQLHLDHPLAAVPILQRIFGFSRSEIPIPGTGTTVRVAPYSRIRGGDGSRQELRVTHGASQRHVSDLGEPMGHFILPGGQSGYPGGTHSADQLRVWLDGGLPPQPIARARVEARTIRRWRLEPGTPEG